MRVIGGRFRGRQLAAPEGGTVRPTSDRAREALFNILAHRDFGKGLNAVQGATVLDAFAGSGALGIEALSRGADAVTFLDSHEAALAAVAWNLRDSLDDPGVTLVRADARFPPKAPRVHDLVFLDPPYGEGLAEPALVALTDQGWLDAGSLVVVETGRDEGFAPPSGFQELDRRDYGKAHFMIAKRVS